MTLKELLETIGFENRNNKMHLTEFGNENNSILNYNIQIPKHEYGYKDTTIVNINEENKTIEID